MPYFIKVKTSKTSKEHLSDNRGYNLQFSNKGDAEFCAAMIKKFEGYDCEVITSDEHPSPPGDYRIHPI